MPEAALGAELLAGLIESAATRHENRLPVKVDAQGIAANVEVVDQAFEWPLARQQLRVEGPAGLLSL